MRKANAQEYHRQAGLRYDNALGPLEHVMGLHPADISHFLLDTAQPGIFWCHLRPD